MDDDVRRSLQANRALIFAALSVLTTVNLSAQEPLSTPCSGPEYRQFDFWIGDWDVRNPSGQIVGTNSIHPEYEGCLLIERWKGAGGGAGTSQNFFHRSDGRWHQNWVDGRASGPLWLIGGLDENDAMVMTDVDRDSDPRNRITWTPNPDGTVRQHWEQSADGGTTWTTAFDGLYVRRDEVDTD